MKDFRKESPRGDSTRVNEQIIASRIQVITETGENLGTFSRREAIDRARAEGLDLVQVSGDSGEGVPIAKIMDFGKVLYAKKKKLADAKKKQKIIKIKEIKMRPKIDEHDYQTKLRRAVQFLEEGDRVKFTLMFRGREAATKAERGQQMFEKIDVTLSEKGMVHLECEKDMKLGNFWSRVYFIKHK